MVKSVQGWTTSDGTFFEKEREALIYEATKELEDALTAKELTIDVFEWLDELRTQIIKYYAAKFNLRFATNEERPVPNTQKLKRI